MTTTPEDIAQKFAAELIENRLAACVQSIDVQSCYHWNGAVEKSRECLLLIKTTEERFTPLKTWIKNHHPYDLPEILTLAVNAFEAAYGAWVKSSVAEVKPCAS